MALKISKAKIKTIASRVKDIFNNDVRWQNTNGEEIDVSATSYEDAEGFSLYVGGDGDVKVDLINGGTVTYVGVLAGTWMPIVATKVYTGDTTATDLIASR